MDFFQCLLPALSPQLRGLRRSSLFTQARGKYVVVEGAPMLPLEERRSLRFGKLSELGLRAASTQVLQLKRLSGRVTIILMDQKGNANKLARMVASKHNGDVYQVRLYSRLYVCCRQFCSCIIEYIFTIPFISLGKGRFPGMAEKHAGSRSSAWCTFNSFVSFAGSERGLGQDSRSM